MAFARRGRLFLCVIFLLVAGVFSTSAQDVPINGTLVQGSPVVGTLENGDEVLRYVYNVLDLRSVTIQALSETVHPTLRIVQGDTEIAAENNALFQSVTSLTTILPAGSYIVEVSAANDVGGTLIVLVDNETPINADVLALGSAFNREVSASSPTSLFTIGALSEEAYLYIDAAAGSNPSARLTDTTASQINALLDGGALGLRVRLPAGDASYLLEVAFRAAASSDIQPFSVCLTPVSVNSCEGTGEPVVVSPLDPNAPVTTVEPGGDACTVTPNVAGGANIRQSATVNSIIAGALPGGAVAAVIGVSPDGAWFNIQFNNITGWVAASVVNVSGGCANVPTVNPPAPLFPTNTPTATPLPTSTPTPTQSGPCLISVFAPTNVYQIPNADISNLQDQVSAGGELIPTGRLADNSWWRTNYAGAWIQTSTFGVTVNVTGNCANLPIVSP